MVVVDQKTLTTRPCVNCAVVRLPHFPSQNSFFVFRFCVFLRKITQQQAEWERGRSRAQTHKKTTENFKFLISGLCDGGKNEKEKCEMMKPQLPNSTNERERERRNRRRQKCNQSIIWIIRIVMKISIVYLTITFFTLSVFAVFFPYIIYIFFWYRSIVRTILYTSNITTRPDDERDQTRYDNLSRARKCEISESHDKARQ